MFRYLNSSEPAILRGSRARRVVTNNIWKIMVVRAKRNKMFVFRKRLSSIHFDNVKGVSGIVLEYV